MTARPQSLRDALAQSQREMVKPGLPFQERVLYKEAVQGLSHTLVDHHAQQGGTLVSAIDAILNGSADVAQGHYRSAQDSLGVMGRILGRVRAAPRRWRPPTNQAQADRARQDRAELKAAASTLAETSGQLSVEVERGLELVQALNANTSELKHSIGSDCGEPGRLWYDALEQRIETARRNDRRTFRAGWRA